jgi:hypothetical protein
MGFGNELPRTAAQLQRHGADPAESQTPEEQLREVVVRLAMGPERPAWAGADWEPLGRVLVFRPWPARSLHVVGQSLLAGEFRRLIAAGAVPGWGLHPVPPSQTPLNVLAGPLLHRSGSMRFYNILERNGFACVEEVAATPDACLLELRNSGPRLVATVRAAISDLGSPHTSTSAAGSSATGAHGSDHAPDPAVAVPQDVAAALRVIAAWAIAERGACLLGELLTLAPATNDMPADVACQWKRLARLSLRPLVGPARPCENLTQLAQELLGETDERRQMILTSRTFAPEPRTYDSLASELGISRERVRQLEEYALTRLARAAQADQYAPLRWRAASVARDRATVHATAADAPPWMAKLLSWLAGKTG